MVMIDSGRERQGFSSANFASTAEDVISAIRSCRQVDMREAQRISADLEMALSKAQEAERF
jgi:hypothetical protein